MKIYYVLYQTHCIFVVFDQFSKYVPRIPMVVSGFLIGFPGFPTGFLGFPSYSQDSHRIPRIHIVFPGFPSDFQDSHRISRIPIGFPRFQGFPSDSQDSRDFHRILKIPGISIGFPGIGNPGNPPFPPWYIPRNRMTVFRREILPRDRSICE